MSRCACACVYVGCYGVCVGACAFVRARSLTNIAHVYISMRTYALFVCMHICIYAHMQMYLSWSGHYQQLQQELERQGLEKALQQERENLIRSEVEYQLAINHPDFHRKQQEQQRSMQRYQQEHGQHQSKRQHEEALEAQRDKIEQLQTQLRQRQCLLQDLRDTVQALLPQRLQPSLPSKQSTPPSPPVPAPQREALVPQVYLLQLSPRVLPVRSTAAFISPPLLSKRRFYLWCRRRVRVLSLRRRQRNGGKLRSRSGFACCGRSRTGSGYWEAMSLLVRRFVSRYFRLHVVSTSRQQPKGNGVQGQGLREAVGGHQERLEEQR